MASGNRNIAWRRDVGGQTWKPKQTDEEAARIKREEADEGRNGIRSRCWKCDAKHQRQNYYWRRM